MARRKKGGIGVCEVIEDGKVPVVLDTFEDRNAALKDLTKRRSALEGMQKYNIMTLPLGTRGEPLLPPGVEVRFYKPGEAEPKIPRRKKGKEEDIAE